MITVVEDFFAKGCGRCARFDTPQCSARQWGDGLRQLRAICLSVGLQETVKWGQACYVHAGRNIAIMSAQRSSFVLGFFNAALMKDPQSVLEKPGPNTQHANTIRFTATGQVAAREATVAAYLREAMTYAEKGERPPRTTAAPDLPDELVEALEADVELAEAFHALTPGRQRSYVINLAGARKPETRIARIAKFREKILSGKGAQER